MRQLTALAAMLVLAASPAFAHSGHEAASWPFDPISGATLVLASLWYAAGQRRLRARKHGRRRLEIAAFAAGILSLAVALETPLDTIAADLFSAHMVQHLLLMLVAAPLFVWSRPLIAFLFAVPRPIRKRLGRSWAGGLLGRIVGPLTTPIAVWVWFCGLFVFWHIPVPYAWALKHEGVHIVEHLCFFLSAFAFWSVVIEPSGRRRLDYGATVLFVATAAILGSLPGALMVLTSRPFYWVHADGAARWGLTLLEDQQLAGLIMWIPAGFAYLAAILVLVALWMREAERRSAARLRRLAAFGTTAAALLVVIAGCDQQPVVGSAPTANPKSFGGDPDRGAAQIAEIGCGACHRIPGITGANALVGPPLDSMARRIYVAGLLRNTPDNMIAWLLDPQKIVPGNAMPNMHLKEQQARDIAAYLYTLE